MTSIVVSLYFKQENCETLISLYNWGRMKRCQSELVSCKVEWFCSLAVFSWWPGLSLFLSVSVCRFPCSLLALCSSLFWKAEKRLYTRGPGGEGCVIRASIVANYSCASACSVPAACGLAVGDQQWAPTTSRPRHLSNYMFSLQINNTLSASAVCLLSYCICPYLHSAEWKAGSFFFILLYQAESKQQSLHCDNTLPLWSNEDMLSGETKVSSWCVDMVVNMKRKL